MRFHILLLGALALTACQTAPAPTPTWPTASPSRTASPTPTAPPEPSFSGERQEIYQTVRNFRNAFDEWGQNPTSEIDDVLQYTADAAQITIANLMERRIWNNLKAKGAPTYRSWSVSPVETLPDGIRQATVMVCEDTRTRSLVLDDGTLSPGERFYWETYTVQQQPNKTWRISTISNEETESC